MLVLDEATSALDAETEYAISATPREVPGKVTTIHIAYRLATLTQCDEALCLIDSEIAAQESLEDVCRQSPAFEKQAPLVGF